MKKAALYIRVSTDEQAAEGFSIPAQKEKLIAYSKIHDWTWELFVDDGYSGKDLSRPEMQRLIKRTKEFNFVVVVKLDRLSRRQKDILHLIEDIFEPNGANFVSITESFDTTSPFGKAALGMMAVFAQLERETIVERSKTGKAQAIKEGRWQGGIAPFGYRYSTKEKGLLEVDENTSHVIPEIFKMYLEGYGYRAISEYLNNKHISTVRRKKWASTTIKGMLSNPVYIGKMQINGTIHESRHSPIISEELWNKVQKEIQYRDNRSKSRVKSKFSLLTGIVHCGECGARMRTKNVWQNYPQKPERRIGYYVCYSQDGWHQYLAKSDKCNVGYKQVQDIDSKVIAKLMNYSVDEELLKSIIDEELATRPDKRKELQDKKNSLEKKLQNIRSRINRWYDAFENGTFETDDTEARERLLKLKDSKISIEQELLSIEVDMSEEIDKGININQLMDMFKTLPDIWNEATDYERQDLIRFLVKNVTVDRNGNVNVDLNY